MQPFCVNFGNCVPILIILTLLHSTMNCRRSYYIICHLTSNLLPHYLNVFLISGGEPRSLSIHWPLRIGKGTTGHSPKPLPSSPRRVPPALKFHSNHWAWLSNIVKICSHYPKLSAGGRSSTKDWRGCVLTAACGCTGCDCLGGSLCDGWSATDTDDATDFSLQCTITNSNSLCMSTFLLAI